MAHYCYLKNNNGNKIKADKSQIGRREKEYNFCEYGFLAYQNIFSLSYYKYYLNVVLY